ncbi:MAG TPA: DUF4384 domain-containing protein, partial [Longimicrobiales bacterium]|nr:DUF4384 domain-containing protein [Longimicrobiales bacterium]
TNADAYVAIFNIDTDGTVRMLYPSSPNDAHYVRGGRDYRLLFPGSQFWYVDDHPGVGYFFIVASPEPFDFSRIDYSYYDRGWDLTRVGRNVYSDPYVAMDDYVAALVPDWEYVRYALDFSTYHVGSVRHDYPRFLCYDCHGFRPYSAWNPYHYACSTFRVVVYTDPWYYPSFRYRGTRVVYTRPPSPFTPRFEFKERALGDPAGVQYVTRPPVADRPGVAGDPALRRSVDGRGTAGATGVTGRPGSDPRAGAGSGTSRPGIPSALRRPTRGGSGATGGRPSSVLPGRSDPRATGPVTGVPRSILPRAGEGVDGRRVVPRGSEGRPVLERRPRSGGTGSSPAGGTAGAAPPTRTGAPGSIPSVGRGGPGTTGSAGTPSARVRPPGTGASPPVRSSPPTGRSGSPPVRRSGGGGGPGAAAPVRPSDGAGSDAGSGRFAPVLGGESGVPSGRRFVPVLGEGSPSDGNRSGGESPPERIEPRAGSNGSSSARPSDGPRIQVYRGGRSGGGSGSVTRSGGIEVIRGRLPPSRPSAVIRSGPGAVRGSVPPGASSSAPGSRDSSSPLLRRGGANTRSSATPSRSGTRPTGVTPGASPPRSGVGSVRGGVDRSSVPTRAGSARSAPTSRGGVSRSSPPSRPPVRVRTGGGGGSRVAPARSSGRSSPPARSGSGSARVPVRRSSGPPASARRPAASSRGSGGAARRPPVRRSGRGGG